MGAGAGVDGTLGRPGRMMGRGRARVRLRVRVRLEAGWIGG